MIITEDRTVLLVEDDDHIRLIVKISLSKLTKWKIIEARDGFQCLEVAAKIVPDLILMDVMMPGMDGVTTFSSLKKNENLKNIPVIFMTAKVQQEEIDDYIKLGACGVITKPIDPMTLPQSIAAIFAAKTVVDG